jgi:hypothetical protein
VKKLQAILEQHWPGLNFIRPDIPVYDPKKPADVAVKELLRTPIPEGSLLVGLGLGAWSLRDYRNSDVRTYRSSRLARRRGRMMSLLKAARRGDSRSIRLKTRSSGQEPQIGRSSRAFRKTWTGLTRKQTGISNTSPGCSTGTSREHCPNGFTTFENPPRQSRNATRWCGSLWPKSVKKRRTGTFVNGRADAHVTSQKSLRPYVPEGRGTLPGVIGFMNLCIEKKHGVSQRSRHHGFRRNAGDDGWGR